MICYFDTSALAKRYVMEEGSKRVQELISQADYIETSALSELELTALFERAKREHRIPSPAYRKVMGYVERDIRDGVLSLVNMNKESWAKAKRLIQQRRLRVADSIQLASAIGANLRFLGDLYFVSADQFLLQAAKLEKLQCINPLD